MLWFGLPWHFPNSPLFSVSICTHNHCNRLVCSSGQCWKPQKYTVELKLHIKKERAVVPVCFSLCFLGHISHGFTVFYYYFLHALVLDLVFPTQILIQVREVIQRASLEVLVPPRGLLMKRREKKIWWIRKICSRDCTILFQKEHKYIYISQSLNTF